jgi:hypothetical protein
MKNDKKEDRFEAYPKPSATDLQLKDQPEFIEPEPNNNSDEELISNDREKVRTQNDEDNKQSRSI